MLADFYTKPLQGSLFRKMRDYIMGHSDSLNEERVENSLNGSICEPENEMGLTSGNETTFQKTVDGDDAGVKLWYGEEQPHNKNTYADIVKGIEKKVKFSSSPHFFKIIQ